MKKILSLILAGIMLVSAFTACNDNGTANNSEPAVTTEAPSPFADYTYKRVVILGVDGMGAFVKDADTPNIDRIFKDGATTYTARTSVPSISGQCWGSILIGSSAYAHGLNNSIVGSEPYENENLPTIFKRVRNAMPDAALASYCHWEPINKGIVEDNIGVVKMNGEDSTLHHDIVTYFAENDPVLFFSHFDSPDGAGHSTGYGNERHLNQISVIDGYIGTVYDALEANGKLEDTLFMVVTDHGGTPGGGHGGYTDAEMNVFFGAAGKSVKKGSTIGEMNNRDIAAIALYALGIEVPAFDLNGFSGQIPAGLFEGYKVPERQNIYAEESTFETLSTPAKDGGKYITDIVGADKVASVFHFENNINDALGNAKAEKKYSPKYYSTGYFGSCIEVGEQGSVALPDVIPTDGSFALSFWFQHNLGSPSVAFFGSHPVSSNTKIGMSALYNGTTITLTIGQGHSSQQLECSIPETTPAGWNNLTAVYNKDTRQIDCYFNFELAQSVTYSKRFETVDFTNSAEFMFGSDPTECNDINIMLDELVIFNTALTAEDVANLAEYYQYEVK